MNRPALVRSHLSTQLLQGIREHDSFRAGDRVAVAVSGGADSVALLHLLNELRGRIGIVLSVAHLNHQLRGRASNADEEFVAKLAAKFALPFHVSRVDVAAKARRDKANLEDTARRTRYAFFAKLVADGVATHVAVAHTADDQAETVLAHILRGTGLAGLGGIHPVSEHIVRPLIQIRRADLRAYLRTKKQCWREDATNRDTTKTRARIRKKLLPLLEKQFRRNIVEHLATLAELAREDEAALHSNAEMRARALVKTGENTASIKVSDLIRQPPGKLQGPLLASVRLKSRAVNKRIVRLIIEELKPRAGQLNAEHAEAVLALAERGENGKSLPLPGGIEVRREHDTLIFGAAHAAQTARASAVPASPTERRDQVHHKAFHYEIDFPEPEVRLPVPCLGCVFRLSVIDWPAKRGETSYTGLVLDQHALRFPLVLRNWRPGDRIRPLGHRNAHKLKRLLNRKRISRWERDGWPVLTSGGVLAWARGFPVAAEFAASERTQVGILIVEEPFS